MKTTTDLGLDPRVASSHADPISWIEAFAALLSSRLGIIQIEGKGVLQKLVKCVAFVAAAALCAVFGYAVLLAGVVSLIARFAEWSWDWVAVAVAVLHLVTAVVLVKLAKPGMENAFAVTRAEFKKDREWLKNFQKTNKSNV